MSTDLDASAPAADLLERLANPTSDDVASMDAWWRANNYLTVGQIYLMDNPLLRAPLAPEHIKPRLLGHWGTSPGCPSSMRMPVASSARRVRSSST